MPPLVVWLLWVLVTVPDIDGPCTAVCTQWRVVMTFSDRLQGTPFLLPPEARCEQYRQYQLPVAASRCLPLGQSPSGLSEDDRHPGGPMAAPPAAAAP
jgi:hypothetical protein